MAELHGLLLELHDEDELLRAARQARGAGISPLDAFTPYPVEGLTAALGKSPSRIPWIMLFCGIAGAVTAFSVMTYSAVIDYPHNVGGRPHFSWPAFVPITFELTILFAALGGALALLLKCGLPRLHHPVFHDRRFREAAQAGFFLLLPADAAARDFLIRHHGDAWREVPQ